MMGWILKDIESKFDKNGLVIGIDGLGGAGKTTMAMKLVNQLDQAGIRSIVLHIDDFIHTRNIRYNDKKEEWYCYYHLQWRYDYLLEEILLPIQSNQEIRKEIELYNKNSNNYKKSGIEITKDMVLIIEGVFLQRPELKPYFDYMIFIDVPKEERLNRVLKRDTYIGDQLEIIDKYTRRYFPAEDTYMTLCNPIASADVIIKGNSGNIYDGINV